MKVQFGHEIFRRQRYGGISRYFTRLYTDLPAQGVDTCISAGLYVNEHLREVNRSRAVFWLGGDGSLPRAARQVGGRVGDRVSRKLYRPDIFHQTYYFSPPPARSKTKLVTTVHDMVYEQYPESWPGDDTAAHKAAWCRRADLVLVNSEHTRQRLLEHLSLSEDRVRVTPLGASDLGRQSPLIIGGIYILYVGGRSGLYKNFKRFVHALRQVSGAFDKLVLFGGGPLTGEERTLLAAVGLFDRVVQVDGSDMMLARAYSGASLFVYPSLEEGFGLPILEAMAQDCPVAASGGGALQEVGGDAAMYFDPGDETSIARSLEKALSNPDWRAMAAQRGRQRVQAFSWTTTASLTADAYRSIV